MQDIRCLCRIYESEELINNESESNKAKGH